jgi:hypothetical protein
MVRWQIPLQAGATRAPLGKIRTIRKTKEYLQDEADHLQKLCRRVEATSQRHNPGLLGEILGVWRETKSVKQLTFMRPNQIDKFRPDTQSKYVFNLLSLRWVMDHCPELRQDPRGADKRSKEKIEDPQFMRYEVELLNNQWYNLKNAGCLQPNSDGNIAAINYPEDPKDPILLPPVEYAQLTGLLAGQEEDPYDDESNPLVTISRE